uniref:Transmembrane 7 superfamily member 3 n=1 Tax=Scleropages formosus TaxID=113540 RepID=A0A8C9W7N4_SCLFO
RGPVWVLVVGLVLLKLGIFLFADRVVFSLGTFKNISLAENATVQAVVSRIPAEVAFLILQFHTQQYNITLSFSKVPTLSSSHTAVDSGLLSPLLITQTSLDWYLLSPENRPLTSVGVILAYGSSDPVPGGCSGDKSFDPSVHLQYNLFVTTVTIAPANAGYARGAVLPTCNATRGPSARLEYHVYQYFLPEGDLSEQSLLSHMQAVASVASMTAHGTKLITWAASEKLSASFKSVPGQGVIYSVVVRDPVLNASASYVPVHTYACSFSSTLDSCMTIGKVSTKIFFTIAGFAGFFVCFFGHQFFKCELFCLGHAFAAVVFFVLITRTTTLEYNLRLALTALVGVVGGVLLVLSWWRFGSVLCCVLVVGLTMGFLLAAAFFFTPVGELLIFRSGAVFWVTFGGIVLLVPLVFVRWPREGNIMTCGAVGAYAVVLAVNSYAYTSLSYITLDILKRFLNNNYSRTFTSMPFQDIDYIMLTVWAVLGVSGVVLQLHRERTRPFFPPSPYLMWKQERERRKTNVLDPSHHMPSLPRRLQHWLLGAFHRKEPAGEVTPLLL